MNEIFVDTSGWANLVDVLQEFHADTKSIYEAAKQDGSRLVTTNYVITELVALMTSPLRISRNRSIAFVDSIKSSSLVNMVHLNEELDAKSWELLKNRVDKNWSLVDCSSFVIMEKINIRDALTTDHHFEQAGFVRLLG
jgi:predicted nucleic acid-binding protein